MAASQQGSGDLTPTAQRIIPQATMCWHHLILVRWRRIAQFCFTLRKGRPQLTLCHGVWPKKPKPASRVRKSNQTTSAGSIPHIARTLVAKPGRRLAPVVTYF
ncbi:uncharacterized protein TrAtP1_010924 [Trichoderma atroviride]|uniref:uncharacterized protein n=1 Tax=Hypocrea atroviridis TaxID=63577 RepID=UPI00332EA03D|nr:hypothetical protein TrAtP1_010924 [Trichoderma atroviride]